MQGNPEKTHLIRRSGGIISETTNLRGSSDDSIDASIWSGQEADRKGAAEEADGDGVVAGDLGGSARAEVHGGGRRKIGLLAEEELDAFKFPPEMCKLKCRPSVRTLSITWPPWVTRTTFGAVCSDTSRQA